MSNLVRSTDRLAAGQVSWRTHREMRRTAAVAVADAAAVLARAYVAEVALRNVALVSAEEQRLTAQFPLEEARFRAIGDAFAHYAARQAAGMGF